MTAYLIRLGQIAVGHLIEDARGKPGIRLLSSYREMAQRPVLGQHFEDDLMRTRWAPRPGLLPAFLANLLPDPGGPLRGLLIRSFALSNPSDAELLCALGNDLPGAIEFSAVDESVEVEAEPEPAELGGSSGGGSLRFSLGGVQLKFSMLREGDRLTLPTSGKGGDWIVKIEQTYPHLAINEFTMLEWARKIGLDVPEHRIVQGDDLSALRGLVGEQPRGLAVRRYDRSSGRKIHQEDFAQVFGWQPEQKYNTRADVLLRVTAAILGQSGYEEQLRRVVFALAIGNQDAHLKNFSLLYPDGRIPALTPIYDQVSTICWPNVSREMALAFGTTRHPSQVDGTMIRNLTLKIGQNPDTAEQIAMDTVSRLRKTWSDVRELLPADHQTAMSDYWQAVPLLRDAGGLRLKSGSS